MQQIRIVKKYVASDGMEFLSLDSATEYQVKIESILEGLKVGDSLQFIVRNGVGGVIIDKGIIESINTPLITIKGEYCLADYYIPDIIIIPKK